MRAIHDRDVAVSNPWGYSNRMSDSRTQWRTLLRTIENRLGIAALAVLMSLALASPAWAQNQLPDFGDSASGTLSPGDERRLGEAFMREIRANLLLIDDPEVEGYVRSLGQRLAAQNEAPTQSFTFFVVGEDSINAFAGPGGYIGVNAGLLLASEREGELASVMAHEVAHVTQRHIARRFDLQRRTNLPVLAGIIAGIVLGTQSPELGQAAVAGVVGTTIAAQLSFGREVEREADRVGMQLLHDAGFDPHAMPAFFERLQTASRFYRRPPEFLSTHPVTTARIADSRARAEQYPYRQYADSESFHLTKAKLRVLLADTPEKSLEYFEDALANGEFRSLNATAYGWGLSLSAAGQTDQAREVLSKLVEENPERTAFKVALADNEFEAKDVDAALTIYSDAYRLYPDNKSLVAGYTRGLIKTGAPVKALQVLDRYSRVYGLDAALYRIEAEAYARSGDTARSRFSLAEHHYLNGQLDAAMHQLKLASQQREADYYLLARVDARLKELEYEHALRSER